MENALIILLSLVADLLPTITGTSSGSTATINRIISALIQIIPVLSAAEVTVVTAVKNMISAITTSGAATPAQIQTLQALGAQVDGSFESTVAAYGANHPNVGVAAQTAPAGGLTG